MTEKLLQEAKKDFEKGLADGRDPVELFEEVVRSFVPINVSMWPIHDADYYGMDNEDLTKKSEKGDGWDGDC